MSGGKTLAEIKTLIDFMRAEGVLEYDGIKLGPKPPAAEQPDLDPEPVAAVKKVIKLGKLGRDGFTYEQQIDAYGEPRDATPDIYEE